MAKSRDCRHKNPPPYELSRLVGRLVIRLRLDVDELMAGRGVTPHEVRCVCEHVSGRVDLEVRGVK